ncbi:response regulator [Arenibacter sp. F20364]|uniref:response regulator n=1 Tax=Arenibacter sp. F20364 TaxID=2926415 RepID=UPI001FF1D533|nr:response regulator [Arenibacter sp. F20364]MCK0192074.1 response regulator [Arenibacter sp. F20364]
MTTTKKTIKIYLADDDEDDRMLFSEALDALPIKCEIRNFKDGIYLMGQLMVKETVLPDIVFLDINMPLMDGVASLKKIRETERISQLPVIIYSTSFVKEEVEKYHHMGANCYLKKPTSFNQLKTLLYKCIRPYLQGVTEKMVDSFVIQV